MAELRIGRGWTAAELEERLEALQSLRQAFAERAQEEMTVSRGWRAERSEAAVACEPPGPPLDEGPFERAKVVLGSYAFSDPNIVTGHYEAGSPLLGRRMLLEIKVLGLRYLCGVIVGAVHDTEEDGVSTFGFRYQTLEGHIERGSEWFLVTKDHETGEVRLEIRSRWRAGDLPNWWSRVGFTFLAPTYRKLWLHRAHERLCAMLEEPVATLEPTSVPMVHEGRRTGVLFAPLPRKPVGAARTGLVAAGLGALTGVRSMSGPATLAWHDVAAGPRPGTGRGEQALALPGFATTITTLGLLECAADKSSRIPSRVSPVALGGRAVIGATVGSVLATRWRAPAALPALAGGLAAAGAAAVATKLRTRAAGGSRVRSAWAGVAEDALVFLGAYALTRVLSKTEPPIYRIGRTEETRPNVTPLAFRT